MGINGDTRLAPKFQIYMIWLLNVVVFLAAFLLFQIELIIAKIFLPKFGGSYLVWGACIVFFQFALFLGYLYAHIVVQKIGIKKYRYWHLLLVFIPFLFFPGKTLPQVSLHQNIPMVIDVFGQLMKTIGIAFFVLSTFSIILQVWLALSKQKQRLNPYTLFASSNFGSFMALLTYPFFFQAFTTISMQITIWRWGYGLLVLLQIILFLKLKVDISLVKEKARSVISKEMLFRWFILGVIGVVMFLSVTNIITAAIAPMPLLWIIPLGIYLFSFVLCFRQKPWCPQWIIENIHQIIVFSFVLFLVVDVKMLPTAVAIILYSFVLFIVCMFCQNELVRSKPSEVEDLTLFYVVFAFGGFVGGIFVNWMVPLVFTWRSEYLIGLIFLGAYRMIGKTAKPTVYALRLILYSALFLYVWFHVFTVYNFIGIIILIVIMKAVFSELKNQHLAVFVMLLLVTLITPALIKKKNSEVVKQWSNFYGIYIIYDSNGVRTLQSGKILHGIQYLDDKRRNDPTAYYHKSTLVGQVLDSDDYSFRSIGAVGLGVGTFAAYVDEHKAMDFFELDEDIYVIAKQYFSFIHGKKDRINVILGDARLSFEQLQNKWYDLIIVDAFNGDSIPLHLLTIEGIMKYIDHLTARGMIFFHTSNIYLDIESIVARNAHHLNAYVCAKKNASLSPHLMASSWLAMTWDDDQFNILKTKFDCQEIQSQDVAHLRSWTDEYTNILAIFKGRGLLKSFENFRPFALGFRPKSFVQNSLSLIETDQNSIEPFDMLGYESHLDRVMQSKTEKIYYSDGSLKHERTLENGVYHGEHTEYYSSGMVKTTWEYHQGQLHGPTREYFESGQLKGVWSYQNNLLHGVVEAYSEDGEKTGEWHYENGKPIK